MLLRWRNGFLSIGYQPCCDGWGIELAWNLRQDFHDPPKRGEVVFYDYKRLSWFGGYWRPVYARYSTGVYGGWE